MRVTIVTKACNVDAVNASAYASTAVHAIPPGKTDSRPWIEMRADAGESGPPAAAGTGLWCCPAGHRASSGHRGSGLQRRSRDGTSGPRHHQRPPTAGDPGAAGVHQRRCCRAGNRQRLAHRLLPLPGPPAAAHGPAAAPGHTRLSAGGNPHGPGLHPWLADLRHGLGYRGPDPLHVPLRVSAEHRQLLPIGAAPTGGLSHAGLRPLAQFFPRRSAAHRAGHWCGHGAQRHGGGERTRCR